MTPIAFNPEEFRLKTENILLDLYYQGKPFTGLLKEDSCITEYKNGFANGEYLEYYPDGSIRAEGICLHGKILDVKEWYQNGQIQVDGDKLYAEDGTLARNGKTWLYRSGKPKEMRLENSSAYFSPQEELAFEVSYLHNGDHHNSITYQNDIMVRNCAEIISDEYPELKDYQTNIEHYIYGWLASLLLKDMEQGKQVLEILVNHPQESVSNGFTYFKDHYPKWNLSDYICKIGYHVTLA